MRANVDDFDSRPRTFSRLLRHRQPKQASANHH
jgi:hypothetical protein